MIETIAAAVGLVALAAVAFLAAVRIGMLLGLRLDRVLEARAASPNGQARVQDGHRGREEQHRE